jgi:DNA-binding transcriptional LysR family regulator
MANLRRKIPSANALFVFEAAGRCGNFTKAAAELYVSQPAVSRMLARMEEHMGVQLFDRVRGGIELTENGRILHERITEGFKGIEEAISEIETRATGTETITLSVSTAFTTHWLMPRMEKLRAAFPGIDLRFQLISGKVGGPLHDVDLGIRFIHGNETEYDSVLVMPEIIVPLCSPAYRDFAERSIDTIINLSDGDREWQRHFPAFSERRHPLYNLIFSDYSIVVQAAMLGQGIAPGWVNIATHWMRNGALVPAIGEVYVTGRLCHLVHAAGTRMRPVVAALRDWIIEETRSDLYAVDAMYPELQLLKLAPNMRAG